MASTRMSGMMNDYAKLRTLPAVLSVVFVLASLYQFGGIAEVSLTWIGYTLSAEHATVISLATVALAFASSETKQFDAYEGWEKVAIAAGPAVIIGHQYVDFVATEFAANDPLFPMAGFLLTAISWGVAVR